MFEQENVFNQELKLDLPNQISIHVKREDLLHPEVSGNKFRKLKYNIAKAKALGYTRVLTFGGAYSNHIAATAAVGRILGIPTIGVIRGEELVHVYKQNPTLAKAEEDGMRFKFVTRTAYREKSNAEFLADLQQEFDGTYIVPEGGTNDEAILGTMEILKEDDKSFTHICVAVGTGGTIAGIINSSTVDQTILGFPALKGSFLSDDINKFVTKSNWKLIHDYHFGGYAKYNAELISFIQKIEEKTDVLFDPIYTGKMMYGVLDLISKGHFPAGSKILVIHTGGLQGWNDVIRKK